MSSAAAEFLPTRSDARTYNPSNAHTDLVSHGVVRIRATLEARVALASPLLATVGFLVASGGTVRLGLAAVTAACIVASDELTCRRGITLTPTAAVLDGVFGTVAIPWARIQAVTVERDHGCSVVLWTDGGTRLRLAEPSAWRAGARFHASAQLVEAWWAAHRGPDWHLTLPVAAPRG